MDKGCNRVSSLACNFVRQRPRNFDTDQKLKTGNHLRFFVFAMEEQEKSRRLAQV